MLLEDDDTHGIVTWSTPTRQINFNCKTNDNENTIRSSSSHSSSNKNNIWRRTLNKLLKGTKSNKNKKGLFLFILIIF
jgi:hypothetical protein